LIKFYEEKQDTILSYAISAVSLLMLIFYFAEHMDNKPFLIALILAPCTVLFYLVIVKEKIISPNENNSFIIREENIPSISSIKNSSVIYKISSLLFFVFLIVSLIILNDSSYYRPSLFFIVIWIMSTFIIIQIFYIAHSKKRVHFSLFQIIVLALISRFSIQPFYPFEINSDAYFHNSLINLILKNGFIPTNFGMYSHYPMYHILNSTGSIVCNVSPLKGYIFFVGIPVLLASLFLFVLITKYINYRAGLISIFFYLMFPINNFFGWVLTPIALSAVYILIMIYLYFRLINPENEAGHIIIKVSLFILVGICCMFTNVLGKAFFIIAILSLIGGTLYFSVISQKKWRNPMLILIFVGISTIYIVHSSATGMLKYLVYMISKKSIQIGAITWGGGHLILRPLTQILSASWFYMFEIIMLLCLLIVVNKKVIDLITSIGIIGTMISIGSILFLDILKIEIAIPYRWFLLTSVFSCFLVGKGIDVLAKIISSENNRKNLYKIALIVFLSTLAMSFIFSPLASFDNPIGEKVHPPAAGVTISEGTSAFAAAHIFINSSNNTIVTDWLYRSFFEAYTNLTVQPFCYNLYDIDRKMSSSNYLIFRKEILYHPYISSNEKGRYIITNLPIKIDPDILNKIYSSNSVYFFIMGDST